MKDLFQIAVAEIGVKEIKGDEDSTRIVDYAQEAGFKNITDDETPWCSIFINWCCMQAGLQRTHKANARSWLTVGLPVDNPIPGDVVIYWRNDIRSWQGHVGLFVGYSKDHKVVFTLGGNQKNSVSIQGYDASKILGFRRLAVEGNMEIPSGNPPLTVGSRGDEVKKLQIILNDLGYNCGATDGAFGQKTETQLKILQKAEGKKADGVYNKDTMAMLENIFQR
jgi:uncharacterized protein (TIGR02594 family)